MPDIVKRSHTPSISLVHSDLQSTEAGGSTENDLAYYLGVIWRRKWIVLAILLAVVAGVWFRTSRITPLYKSTATIQIDSAENILPYQQIYQSVSTSIVQVEVLKSYALANRVAAKLNQLGLPGRVIGADTVLANLSIDHVPGSQLAKVSYESPDADLTAKVVNVLIEEYVDFNFEQKTAATNKATEFLRNELEGLKARLEGAESELIAYARDHNIPVLIAQPTPPDNVVFRKLTDLNLQMTGVEATLIANRYEDLKDADLKSFPESAKTIGFRELERQLKVLEERLAGLSLQFGPKWPEVLLLKDQIASVQDGLKGEMQQAIEETKVEYELASEHRRRIAEAVQQQNDQLGRLNDDSIEYNALKREVETDQQLYEGLLQRLKQAAVSADVAGNSIRVIDPARVPDGPDSPNAPFNLAVGLALGLVSGVMFAFVVDYADKTMATEKQLERSLGLPSLAAIPSLGKSVRIANPNLLAKHEDGAELTATALGLDFMRLPSWESYRWLRTTLLLTPGKPPQTILVTSALAGEGKSTTSINLGISFAQTGARTLILALDMRKPVSRAATADNSEGGMSNYLAGNCELATQVQQTSVPNLFIVPAGPIPPNPPELIGSDRMRLALALLSGFFQYIIIDTPPVLSVTDALVLSPHVDGVLLVVKGGQSPKEAVAMARDRLLGTGAKLLGAVMNDVYVRKSTSAYYSGY